MTQGPVFCNYPPEAVSPPLTGFSFFSDRSPKSRLIQLKKEKLEYCPGEHDYGLFPAPIHVGECQRAPRAAQGPGRFCGWGEASLLFSLSSLCLRWGRALSFSIYTHSQEFWKLFAVCEAKRCKSFSEQHISVAFDSLRTSSRKTQLFIRSVSGISFGHREGDDVWMCTHQRDKAQSFS